MVLIPYRIRRLLQRVAPAWGQMVNGLRDVLLLPWWSVARGKRRILFCVHAFAPRIGGSELHVQWMAEHFKSRGFAVAVCAPRTRRDPRWVDGIPVFSAIWPARFADAVLAYTATPFQETMGRYVATLTQRPRLLHHPCALCDRGLGLVRQADAILAFTERDAEIAREQGVEGARIFSIRPASHDNRKGIAGEFAARHGITDPYLVWVGAWLPAKGALNLSQRFAAYRERHPEERLKLVMFGGYGTQEYPLEHPDILRLDHNMTEVPDALAGCLFLAFNSPPQPVGFDCAPLVLCEAFMNRKTFVAQAGTPLLSEVGSLGVVVETDEQWMTAVERLVGDPAERARLESACHQAYLDRYNMRNMMADVEQAVRATLAGIPRP
jgi:glycosyltransferase involved in cell wall biosynthesis